MAKIIQFNGITKLDLPVNLILEDTKKRDMEGIVILGYDGQGNEYFSSTYADGGTVLWLLERAKKLLLEISEEDVA